jgi:hypothetical protein
VKAEIHFADEYPEKKHFQDLTAGFGFPSTHLRFSRYASSVFSVRIFGFLSTPLFKKSIYIKDLGMFFEATNSLQDLSSSIQAGRWQRLIF